MVNKPRLEPLVNEMQTSLLANPSVHPVCTAWGIPFGRKCNPGLTHLLPDRKQKAVPQPAGRRQHCVHTRAANSTPSSVNSSNTRTQEASAPAMAAASHHSHGQAQEGMLIVLLMPNCPTCRAASSDVIGPAAFTSKPDRIA